MFGDYVFEKTAAQYTKKMMLVDADHLEENVPCGGCGVSGTWLQDCCVY